MASEVDTFRATGREAWWLCQAKQSESTFSNAVFEKTVQVKATFRGFNTLQRLAAKHLKAGFFRIPIVSTNVRKISRC